MMKKQQTPTARRRWMSALLTLVMVLGTVMVVQHYDPQEVQAKGRKPADVFKQRIALSTSPYPPRFETDASFIKYIKRVDKKEFWPTSEKGPWIIYYMSFFAQPLDQKSYLVQFFDITEGEPELITQSTTRNSQTGLRIMAGDYALEQGLFKGDRKILMLIVPNASQTAIAEVVFVLRPYNAAHAAQLKRDQEAQQQKRMKRKTQIKDKTLEWSPPEW